MRILMSTHRRRVLVVWFMECPLLLFLVLSHWGRKVSLIGLRRTIIINLQKFAYIVSGIFRRWDTVTRFIWYWFPRFEMGTFYWISCDSRADTRWGHLYRAMPLEYRKLGCDGYSWNQSSGWAIKAGCDGWIWMLSHQECARTALANLRRNDRIRLFWPYTNFGE